MCLESALQVRCDLVIEWPVEEVLGKVPQGHGRGIADCQLALVDEVEECREGVRCGRLEGNRTAALNVLDEAGSASAREEASKILAPPDAGREHGPVNMVSRVCAWSLDSENPVGERALGIVSPAEWSGRGRGGKGLCETAQVEIHGGGTRPGKRPEGTHAHVQTCVGRKSLGLATCTAPSVKGGA